MVPGLDVGGICSECWKTLQRRAARLSRWVAMGTTVPLVVYLMVILPAQRNARLMGAVVAVTWYLLTSLIARRVAMEWMK